MVRLSSLSDEIRAALAIHDDGHGSIKQEILVQALQNFSQMSQNKIPISALDKKIQPDLEKLDKDKDGYLTIDEIGGLGRKFSQQRNRLRDVFGVGIVGFVFTLMSLGAVVGLTYLALDLNKDVRASRGLLTNREDGTPMKASSTTYTLQDNVLHSGGQTETSVDNTNSAAVATLIQEYKFNEISDTWANQALSAVTKLSIMPKPLLNDDHGPFLHTRVAYIARLPNRAENNGGSVVLMHTPAGRFVIIGSTVQPATGELATLDGSALHMESVRLPSRRSLATASGRRQNAQRCLSLDVCKHRRQTEINCCDGQIYKCTTATPPYSCPRGSFCPSSTSYPSCQDMRVLELETNPYGCAGNYILQYNEVWDGPSFVGPKCAYVISGSTWYLISRANYTALATQSPTILGTAAYEPYYTYVKGVLAYEGYNLPNAESGIYCPGSTQAAPGLWYAPPFFRKCAPGFYCYKPEFQFPCNNLVLTLKPGYSNSYAGTYYLSSQIFNGQPVYKSFKYSQSCGYMCSTLVDYSCTQQNCGGASVFAGIVYSTNSYGGGIYSIIPGPSLSQVTSGQATASAFAFASTAAPAFLSLPAPPTDAWTQFTGAWGARTLLDVICPGGSKLPSAGVYVP